jgi:drug/metabolite transporter (DMT)-like permease
MPRLMASAASSKLRAPLAYSAVYFVWGSTYLAMKYGIESLPPFLLAGFRFLSAGAALYAWSALRRAGAPSARQWRDAAIVGALMLLGSNGLVCWAEQTVPSGAAALFIATVPIFVTIFQWTRPSSATIAGIVLGFAGIAVLAGPKAIGGHERIDPRGALALLFAAASWSLGSLYARSSDRPESKLQAAGMQMLAGGALLVLAAWATGQWRGFTLAQVTPRSALALAYLAVFGSIVAFSAYTWLLDHTTPERAVTYAYVNPVVAVLLGWAWGGEALTVRVLAASAIIVTAVALIVKRW